MLCWAWGHTPLIQALRKQKGLDLWELKASHGFDLLLPFAKDNQYE